MLYAIQLLVKLGQDFKGSRFLPGLAGLVGGLVAICLAILLVLGVDHLYPVGSAATEETFFVRVSFLIPLSYLAAALSGLFMTALLKRTATANIIQHVTYLGITLIILAPIAEIWYRLARQALQQYL